MAKNGARGGTFDSCWPTRPPVYLGNGRKLKFAPHPAKSSAKSQNAARRTPRGCRRHAPLAYPSCSSDRVLRGVPRLLRLRFIAYVPIVEAENDGIITKDSEKKGHPTSTNRYFHMRSIDMRRCTSWLLLQLPLFTRKPCQQRDPSFAYT